MPKRVHETMSKQSRVEAREGIPGRQTAKIPQGKQKKEKKKKEKRKKETSDPGQSSRSL